MTFLVPTPLISLVLYFFVSTFLSIPTFFRLYIFLPCITSASFIVIRDCTCLQKCPQKRGNVFCPHNCTVIVCPTIFFRSAKTNKIKMKVIVSLKLGGGATLPKLPSWEQVAPTAPPPGSRVPVNVVFVCAVFRLHSSHTFFRQFKAM